MAKFVPDDVPAWKIELTEKLAASRAKRSGRATSQPRLPLEHSSADAEPARASVLAAVAARYAAGPAIAKRWSSKRKRQPSPRKRL